MKLIELTPLGPVWTRRPRYDLTPAEEALIEARISWTPEAPERPAEGFSKPSAPLQPYGTLGRVYRSTPTEKDRGRYMIYGRPEIWRGYTEEQAFRALRSPHNNAGIQVRPGSPLDPVTESWLAAFGDPKGRPVYRCRRIGCFYPKKLDLRSRYCSDRCKRAVEFAKRRLNRGSPRVKHRPDPHFAANVAGFQTWRPAGNLDDLSGPWEGETVSDMAPAGGFPVPRYTEETSESGRVTRRKKRRVFHVIGFVTTEEHDEAVRAAQEALPRNWYTRDLAEDVAGYAPAAEEPEAWELRVRRVETVDPWTGDDTSEDTYYVDGDDSWREEDDLLEEQREREEEEEGNDEVTTSTVSNNR